MILALARFLRVGHKKGSKGGCGYHDDGRADFNFVPEDLSDDICLREADANLRHAHDGDDYHHDGETESVGLRMSFWRSVIWMRQRRWIGIINTI